VHERGNGQGRNVSDPIPEPVEPSFEAALAELEAIVHRLEEGDIPLDEALARYESGVRLLKRCFALLEQAEQRIELLSDVDAQGNAITAPFDAAATSLDEQPKSRSRRRSAPQPPASEPPPSPPPSADVDAPDALF
jgi:exodeoxyribonuclease VII small subunit